MAFQILQNLESLIGRQQVADACRLYLATDASGAILPPLWRTEEPCCELDRSATEPSGALYSPEELENMRGPAGGQGVYEDWMVSEGYEEGDENALDRQATGPSGPIPFLRLNLNPEEDDEEGCDCCHGGDETISPVDFVSFSPATPPPEVQTPQVYRPEFNSPLLKPVMSPIRIPDLNAITLDPEETIGVSYMRSYVLGRLQDPMDPEKEGLMRVLQKVEPKNPLLCPLHRPLPSNSTPTSACSGCYVGFMAEP